MHKPGKRFAYLFALLVLIALMVFAPRLVSASSRPDLHLPTPIPPEPYPLSGVYPAKVYLASRADLQVLYDLTIDVDGLQSVDGGLNSVGLTFKPAIATIYINAEQSLSLYRAGLIPIPIKNEGYRSFMAHGPGSGAPNAWPTFEQYVTRMQSLAAAHTDIMLVEQIGTSVQGRGLFCMEVTDNPGVHENEPEFKYTANHHGDETTGIEMTMRFAELLANSYGTDPTITDLVNKTEIWLCPIYNPDGYVAGERYNAHGVDLNRDFPDRFTDPIDDPTGREPETQAFMNFGYAHRFVMGANYHGGEQVLNYPWDAVSGPPLYAPDDQLFYNFGIGYTSRNPDLWNNPYFDHGITRGWEWYMIYGGMQDWAYYYHGEHHVTLEISWDKGPDYSLMDGFWDRNRPAMLWWMTQVGTGMSGLVRDAASGNALNATVTLVGRDIPNNILTDPEVGDYHRVISAGSYELMASAACHQSQSAQVQVISDTVISQDFNLVSVPDLRPSAKTVSAGHGLPGDNLEYKIRIENGCITSTATVTDNLPVQVTWTGYLTATEGTPVYDAGEISWQGVVSASQPVTITYGVTLNQCLAAATSILNQAWLDTQETDPITRTAEVRVDNASPSLPASPFPVDGAIGQPITTTLSWAASSDLNCDPISYDLYFGTTDHPTRRAHGLVEPAFDPGALLPQTTYYWYAIADDGRVHVTGPLWSFTTGKLIHTVLLPLTIRSGQ